MHRLARPPLVPFLVAVTAAFALGLPAARAGGREREPRLTPKERARVELGRRLFFDPTVSRSGARACASCHDPEHGYSDRAAKSRDDVGLTRRHSQTLIDGALNPNAHWDGEFESLESLITARLKPASNGRGLASHGASLGDVAMPTGDRLSQPSGGATTNEAQEQPEEKPEEEKPKDDPEYGGESKAAGEARAPEEREAKDTSAPGGDAAAAPPPEPSAPGQAAVKPETPTAPVDPSAERGGVDVPEPEPFVRPEDPQEPLDVRRLPRVDVVVEQGGRYRDAFVAAYGSPDVNVDRLAGALAAYCRTLASTRSPFDRHRAGEADVLTAEQRRGLALFQGRARCAQCHLDTPGPDGRVLFTDYAFHDTGVALRAFAREPAQTRTMHVTEADRGREKVSTRPQDRRAFKTPSLRDVARRGPYFHDGSAKTLRDVVRWYAEGGNPGDPHQDPRVRPIALTPTDVGDLVAFLRALSGDERPGLAREAWKARAEKTKLTFVDGVGRPLAKWTIRLETAGDVLPGWNRAHDAPRELVTDDDGAIVYDVPRRTHVRLVLPEGLPPLGGDLVPDTCAAARIEVPVDGRLSLGVLAAKDRALPRMLAAEHVGLMRLPGHPAPRTLLVQLGTEDAGDGEALTVYRGWRRTDVPASARLLVPGAPGKPVARVPVELGRTTVPIRLPAP